MTTVIGIAYALCGIGVILSTCLRRTAPTRRAKTAVLCAEAIWVLGGALCLGISLWLAAHAEGGTAAERAWAADAFALWLKAGGSTAAVTGGILLCAALIRHRRERIRAFVGCMSFLVMLLFGGCYGVLCVGEGIDPSLWVWLSALGMAGLLRLGAAADALFARFSPVSEKMR